MFHGIAASFTAQWSDAGAELAWRHRASLSPRDQLLLEAFLGTRDSLQSTTAERLRLLERLTEDSPDRAEAWYLRGDYVYHYDLRTPLPERLARDWQQAACAAGQYYAATGETERARALAGRLRAGEDSYARACLALLHVALAPADPELSAAVARLDALLGDGAIPDPWLRDASTLVLAAGYERLGSTERALDAVRRRTVGVPGARFLSTQLREEARLATALGLTEDAARARGHYTALRSAPE